MHSVQFSNLSGSDGSVLFATGDTVVQAAVYGPTEIKTSKELCDKAVIEVTFKPKFGQPECKNRQVEFFIRNAVESVILATYHPRSCISIVIQEIQDAGNLLACSVNAACLALLDAGIPMQGTVAAISIALVEGKFISFPSSKDLKLCSNVATVCVDYPGKNLVEIQNSFSSVDELKKIIEVAKTCAEDVFQFYRSSYSKRYKKIVSGENS